MLPMGLEAASKSLQQLADRSNFHNVSYHCLACVIHLEELRAAALHFLKGRSDQGGEMYKTYSG